MSYLSVGAGGSCGLKSYLATMVIIVWSQELGATALRLLYKHLPLGEHSSSNPDPAQTGSILTYLCNSDARDRSSDRPMVRVRMQYHDNCLPSFYPRGWLLERFPHYLSVMVRVDCSLSNTEHQIMHAKRMVMAKICGGECSYGWLLAFCKGEGVETLKCPCLISRN